MQHNWSKLSLGTGIILPQLQIVLASKAYNCWSAGLTFSAKHFFTLAYKARRQRPALLACHAFMLHAAQNPHSALSHICVNGTFCHIKTHPNSFIYLRRLADRRQLLDKTPEKHAAVCLRLTCEIASLSVIIIIIIIIIIIYFAQDTINHTTCQYMSRTDKAIGLKIRLDIRVRVRPDLRFAYLLKSFAQRF